MKAEFAMPKDRVVRQSTIDWLKHAGLRWVTLYFVLYILLDDAVAPFLAQFQGLQFLTGFGHAQALLWRAIVPWLSGHFFGHPIFAPSLGTDHLFDYTENGIIIALALLLAFLWSSLDREDKRERTFYDGTRLLLRYFLAGVFLWYGLPKILPCGFFCFPPPAVLMQPYGNVLPHNLMWFFFGYSYPYSIVIGLAEMLGPALLIFRRTTTLGALILAGVAANVMLMNVFYTVGVILFSANLTLMALFLLAPDARRIGNVVLGYPASGSLRETRKPETWRVALGVAAKVLFYLLGIVP